MSITRRSLLGWIAALPVVGTAAARALTDERIMLPALDAVPSVEPGVDLDAWVEQRIVDQMGAVEFLCSGQIAAGEFVCVGNDGLVYPAHHDTHDRRVIGHALEAHDSREWCGTIKVRLDG